MKKFLYIMGNVAEFVIDYGLIILIDIILVICFAHNNYDWKAYAVLAAASAVGGLVWKFILKYTEKLRDKIANKITKKFFENK